MDHNRNELPNAGCADGRTTGESVRALPAEPAHQARKPDGSGRRFVSERTARRQTPDAERWSTEARSMLSLQRCRAILGRGGSDAELESVRDQMYALADVVVRAFLERRQQHVPDGAFSAALRLLPSGDADDATERAAIVEFEGGRNRDEAERQALLAVVGRHRGAREER